MAILKLPVSLKGTKIIAQGKADRPQPWVQDKNAFPTLKGSNDHHQILLPFRERKMSIFIPGVLLVPLASPQAIILVAFSDPFVFNS